MAEKYLKKIANFEKNAKICGLEKHSITFGKYKVIFF